MAIGVADGTVTDAAGELYTRPRIDRREDARIVRSALDEVRSIQTLLADVYKDAGDGRTLLRELVQNADDAEATRLVFVVLDRGWPGAQNSLLRGPALVVANNGSFPASDRDALHLALGGSKADDAGKVGRFGVGLKSVFHICEALVYVGAEAGVLRPGALNPWAGTGERGAADPLHPDWDAVSDEDLDQRLLKVAGQLLETFHQGLILWIPLRVAAHRDRARDRPYGLGEVCPMPSQLASWFGRRESLALLLAQCGHLRSVEADQATSVETLSGRVPLARVSRPTDTVWVGRPVEDRAVQDRTFEGRIEATGRAWSITGIEAVGSDVLRALRSDEAWPKDPHWRDGRSEWVPRKALAHASITILRPDGPAETVGVRFRWAVFLPLDDDPNPRTTTVVEALGPASGDTAWDIVLHGYFWPSHDRRSIPGVTEDDPGSGDNAVRVRWNRAVRDELLLPLLPSALAKAVDAVPDDVSSQLLKAIAGSRAIDRNLTAVTRRDVLLPVITEGGVRWTACPAGSEVMLIPAWTSAPASVRKPFAARLRERSDWTVVDADSPRIGGRVGTWSITLLGQLLDCIAVEVLQTSIALQWLKAVVTLVVGRQEESGYRERVVLLANWLTERIGEGALAPAIEGPDREELRAAWRRILAVFPSEWVVDSPVGSYQAVAELAAKALFGEGLLPVPLGRRAATSPLRPELRRVDSALLELGKRLSQEHGSSQRAHRSRLLLAETLLSVRAWPLSDALSRLPLLRAQMLPEEKDEAWSAGRLHHEMARVRVFGRPAVDDGAESTELDAPSDPKKAVKDLAEAINENTWLVDEAVASAAGAARPTPTALADAVIRSDSIQSAALQRLGLVRRLADHASDARIRRALRSLLTGRVWGPDDDHELLYVRSQDSDKEANRRTLGILLRLLNRSWRAVEAGLVEPLPHGLVDDLGVSAVDSGVMHRLLSECLETAPSADWAQLDQSEILHLLRNLYGTDADDHARWRAMPLHRGVAGDRGAFDDRALRATGDLRLPHALEEEIRLLQPDREVANLYLDVPPLDDDGVLRAMLVSSRPHRFAAQIIQGLRDAGDGRVVLPRDPKLLALLRQTPWMPHGDNASGFAPDALIAVPPQLRESVAPLARSGALGDHRLPEDIPPAVWSIAETVLHELFGRPSRARQVQRLAGALVPIKVADVDRGAFLVCPCPDAISAALVDDVMHSPLAGSHRGWALVRSAMSVVGEQHPHEAVLNLARSLCGPVPVEHQIDALAAVAATHPPKDSPSGRVFRSLLESFAATSGFFESVLPRLELPTQDGQWRPARDIARSASGVARRHQVVSDLRPILRLDSDDPVHVESAADVRIGSGTAESLARYFEPWVDRVPHGALGAFLAILGNGKDDAIVHLAEQWLGDDVNIEGMRQHLTAAGDRDPCARIKIFVSGRIAHGQRVEAVNILGQRVEMDVGSDDDSIFATDPVRRSSALGDFWEIGLRDVAPERRTAHDLVALLSCAVEWWAVRVLRLEVQQVRDWWSRWGTGSQAQVGPVQASILAHLPLTLHQLDVQDNGALRDALREAQRAQRRREQATASQIRDAMEVERAALDKLAVLIREHSEHQHFLWLRVQDLMRRFGYRDDSVLLELAQNADDALAQSAEIAGGELPTAVRRLVVRVHVCEAASTIDVIHYGRPINDTGGAAFPSGRDRQWDQDLYFMMLLNLSGKPGEFPGSSSAASTTGRFGLGFKAVHLVSASPSVVSGFLAFSIAGGLLPLEQPVPNESDLHPLEGRRVTRFRLPLRNDVAPPDLIERMFGRFLYTRALLPVFARQIREVVVEGGPLAGISSFDPQPIEGATGWTTAAKTIEIVGHGEWRLLRFRLSETGAGPPSGTPAIAVGLKDGMPAALPSDVPFLWNVAPTSEGWACGYAVNGPFKLDPGRTHVSLDDEATGRVVDLLGGALGKGLIELHDALLAKEGLGVHALQPPRGVHAFVSSLWKVLSSGIDTPDELRRKLLLRLHGPDRGLSIWMAARSVVPSELPAPFSVRLPALKPGLQIEIAEGSLDKPHVCQAFAQIPELASAAQKRPVVSKKVAERLRPLLAHSPRPLHPCDLLEQLAERWDHVLTPERLRALRPLSPETIWKATDGSMWNVNLVARAANGTPTPLRALLLPPDLGVGEVDTDVQDELLRAAFAPKGSLLQSDYISQTDDLTMFLRLRARHQIDARTMASWFGDLAEERRAAALRYLLRGKLQQEVLQWLIPIEERPVWLEDYNEVRQALNALQEDRWRSQALLAALFPDRFEEPSRILGPLLPDSAKQSFFDRLEQWWNQPNVRRAVVESYEEKAWPHWLRHNGLAAGLESGSVDHWLALLVLGASRSLGRAEAGHHRTFLEAAHSEGWWEIFKRPDDVTEWMEVLRSWQDRAVANLTYPRWMSLFPSIFQVSRYLEKYRRLLTSTAQRPAELYRVTCLLAPRVDEALTGAGYHFDAPPAPLNMGLHWVLRELVRLGQLDATHVYPDCWVPSERIFRFLQPLGLEPLDGASSNSEKAHAIFQFLANALGTDTPHLHRAFDIPLRHIDSSADLRRRFGLED